MAPAIVENKKKNKVEKWEIEGWVRTLREAEQIKNDPAKMKLVQPYLKKEIKSIEDLKELLNSEMETGEE